MPRLLSLATLYPNAHVPRFGTFVARQLEALAARPGWEVTVINPIGVPPLAPGRYRALAAAALPGREGGVEVLRPRFTLIPAIGGRFNPALITRAVLPLARRLHQATPFDLVDAQFFYPDGPVAARIAAALDLPLAIKARGADISFWGRRRYANRMMREAAAQAGLTLAVSAALARDKAAIGLPAARTEVHYTGLDRETFRPQPQAAARAAIAARHGLVLKEGDRLLACVGALIPRKGQALAIEALAGLPGCRLALVGTGPDRAALKALAQRRGLGERVHFLGSLDHAALAQVLCAADAMVLPSASEGLANAWVEALACGTPLVITDVGGARELVTTPEAGRLVARDPDAIAAGICAILAEPHPREAVAACVSAFSWAENAARLAQLYEGLLASRRRPPPPPPQA